MMSQVVLISGVGELTNSIYTVEPLNNGHVGTDHFVHYREVVLFGGKNVMPLHRLAHRKVSFIQRCPLFRVSFVRGSTVLGKAKGVPLSRYPLFREYCIYQDTLGPEKSILFRNIQTLHLGWQKVLSLQRCPHFQGVLLEGFHCI